MTRPTVKLFRKFTYEAANEIGIDKCLPGGTHQCGMYYRTATCTTNPEKVAEIVKKRLAEVGFDANTRATAKSVVGICVK